MANNSSLEPSSAMLMQGSLHMVWFDIGYTEGLRVFVS